MLRLVDMLPLRLQLDWLRYVARRRLRQGKPEAARLAIERAIRLSSDDPETNELLERVRQQVRGTVVLPGASEPVLPLRRSDFAIGSVVRGAMTRNRWHIDERLGHGSMGVVFRVTNLAVDKSPSFALKTYSAVRAVEERVRPTFNREVRTWIRLGRHPNIVQAYFAETLERTLCVLMEYVPGGSVRSVVGQPLTIERVLSLALNLCDALQYAHDTLKVVHRDVKPDNCLIGDGGVLKLSDFGVSTVLRPFATTSVERSDDRFIVGTPDYRAPEQANPANEPDQRADIHAFGFTIAELLAGKWQSRDAIAAAVDGGERAGPLWQLLRRCVAFDRERRPGTFADVRKELEACHVALLGTGAPSPPTATPPTARELQDRAATFLALGSPPDAIESYRQALELEPSNDALWAGLCAAYHLNTQHAEAIDAADEGLAFGRRTSTLLNNKAKALAAMGRLQEARQCLEEVIGFDGSNPQVLCNLAEIFWQGKDPDASLRWCDETLTHDARFIRALILKANVLMDVSRVTDAYEALRLAANIDPHDFEVNLGFAIVLHRQNRLEEALRHASFAAEVQSTNRLAVMTKGWLLLQTQQASKAIKCFDVVLDQDASDIEALRGKGLALLSVGEPTDAMTILRRAQQIAPDNQPVQEAIALAEAMLRS